MINLYKENWEKGQRTKASEKHSHYSCGKKREQMKKSSTHGPFLHSLWRANFPGSCCISRTVTFCSQTWINDQWISKDVCSEKRSSCPCHMSNHPLEFPDEDHLLTFIWKTLLINLWPASQRLPPYKALFQASPTESGHSVWQGRVCLPGVDIWRWYESHTFVEWFMLTYERWWLVVCDWSSLKQPRLCVLLGGRL